MVEGIETLNYLAAAIETTRGTVVSTMTRKLYPKPGTLVFTQDVGTIKPRESWANYAELRRAYPGLERFGIVFQVDITFEDWAYFNNFFTLPLLTGSLSDTSAYTWTQAPTAATDTLKSASMELCSISSVSVVGWRVPGLVGSNMSVTWKKADVGDDETGLTATLAFMTASAGIPITAVTGSLADRTLINATGMTTLSYINVVASAHGTTADPLVREATFTLDNGFQYKDGFAAASSLVLVTRKANLTLQRYFDNLTERTAYIAKTTRRVQLVTTGALAGAATALYTVKLNYTGVPDAAAKGDVNGIWVENIGLDALYDSGLAATWQWITINKDSTTLS